jgi:hypothetical protein
VCQVPAPLPCVACYPHTFDLVEFSSYEARDTIVGGVWAREIGSPSWKPLDRGTVESLVGERLD